jgi:hypothetical protein
MGLPSPADHVETETVVHSPGRFLFAIRGGERNPDASWERCRMKITTENLTLVTANTTRTISHDSIEIPSSTEGLVPEGVDLGRGDTAPFRVGNNLLVVQLAEASDLETAYHRAVLSGQSVWSRYEPPSSVGTERPKDWERTEVRLSESGLVVLFDDETEVGVEYESITDWAVETRYIEGATRPVVEVAYAGESSTDEEIEGDWQLNITGNGSETTEEDWRLDLTGKPAQCRTLRTVLEASRRSGETGREAATPSEPTNGVAGERAALSEVEREVLSALDSGISSFEVPRVVGLSVEKTEGVFQELRRKGCLELVRRRSEVSLTADGRRRAEEAEESEGAGESGDSPPA